ncbi:hypothetical protein ACEPAF_3932 [Sanghuangporus sanghuang]
MLTNPSEGFSRRLEQAETSFFDSLNDYKSLFSFESAWSSLRYDLLQSRDEIDTKTGTTAYVTASRVSIVAESLSEVHTKSSALEMSLQSELGRILDSIYPGPATGPSAKSKDRSISSEQTQLHEPSTLDAPEFPASKQAGPRPTHEAHIKWLLEHLHNPFPPAPVKKELAKTLNMTPKSLDDWFSNARRKVGWIAFSKRHFQGNRSLTLDCAHRVWVEGKGQMYNEDIVRELEEVKATAQRLYGSPDKNTAPESSCFAKEIESLEAETVAVSKSRKRRPSTCSNASEQTIVSSTSSDCPSRKRARASSEESDATCCEDQMLSLKPFKRARSVSSACSSASHESSFSSLSSDSADTVSEVSTPAMSPTHPHLPIEIFDGWMDGLSAGSPFLPHDAVDKPPEKVLSQKRASPDSDSDTDTDVPSKRARLDSSQEPLPPPAANGCNTPNPKLSRSVATALAEAAPPSPTHSPTKASVERPPTNEATITIPAPPAAAEEVDVEAAKAILSQLDYSVPPPPIWDDELVESALEATLLSLASCGAGEIGSSSGLPGDIDALWANTPVLDTALPAAEENSVGPQTLQECTNEPNDTVDASRIALADQCESIPFSLSLLDFDFLESLGNIAPVPSVNPPTCDKKLSVPLIDIAPIPESDKFPFDDSERTEKLERIEQLLAEAQKLQQEVFG